MKNIGGFFELEISEGHSVYHDSAIKLSTARAALNYILKAMSPSKIYVPFYCCDALIEPILLNGIDYEFYAIDELLEIKYLPSLKEDEIIIGCDFFGIKSKYMFSLLNVYGNRLIIDNTHSFFSKGYETNNCSFTSARKYFGVPDGAFLYSPDLYKLGLDIKRNRKISINHNVHRLIGDQELAFNEFIAYEKTLGSKIENISLVSERILSTIDYSKIRKIRNDNYKFLYDEFREINLLKIDENELDCFCYPLLLEEPLDKEKLYKQKMFIPNLWLDTLDRNQKNNYAYECKLSVELLPLPIDHRYSIKDLDRMSRAIKELVNG